MVEEFEAHITTEVLEAKWREIAPFIDVMAKRVGQRGEFAVQPGSSLSGDDRVSNPFHVSHVVRQCLVAGVDHLHAVKALVVDQRVLHVAAPASLARGALENFAAGYWVLGPVNRDTRVERALRWHATNVVDDMRFRAALGEDTADLKVRRIDRIRDVATARNLETGVTKGYRISEVVRFADEQLADLALGVYLPWQVCSGMAHGRPWAYLGSLNREESDSDEVGVANVRLTNDVGRALYPTLAAFQLMESLLRLMEQRLTRQTGG